jgi:SAM-dependent methyltransferase
MPLNDGERQVESDLSQIRRDHVARYEWAARLVEPGASVLDYGCGIGYGSSILSASAGKVYGLDVDAETLEFARNTWARENVEFRAPGALPGVGIATAFEVIEHIADPALVLLAIREASPVLLASVPNERVFPWNNTPFHFRHYTREQFEGLLNRTGWKVVEWWGQLGGESEVERDVEGRTLIAKCERVDIPPRMSAKGAPLGMTAGCLAGQHVAIVGLGGSAEAYMDHVKRIGSRAAFCEQVWGINAIGSVLDCDLVFHMDDVRIQAIRAEAKPQSNIANMLQWLRTSRVPVMTSRAHPDFPALVEFPFQEVVNNVGRVYFNNTAAYAIAFAVYCGVRKISLFGCDYTYPGAHKAEKGRANSEFWLGVAVARGIEIGLPASTTLLDGNVRDSEADVYAYGYDTLVIEYREGDAGEMLFDFTERAELPTAEEVEAAYDHGRPPAQQHLRKTSQ